MNNGPSGGENERANDGTDSVLTQSGIRNDGEANSDEAEANNEGINDDDINYVEPELPPLRVFSYVVGHFFNDLCACLWFSYVLLFFERVKGYSEVQAGSLFLLGQVTDAICTPLVGLGSDRLPLPRVLRRYGRRKTWHALGNK